MRWAQFAPVTVSSNSQGPLLPVLGDEAPEAWRSDLSFSRSCSYRTADPGFTFGALLIPGPLILATVTILLFAVSQVLTKSASPGLVWVGWQGGFGTDQVKCIKEGLVRIFSLSKANMILQYKGSS